MGNYPRLVFAKFYKFEWVFNFQFSPTTSIIRIPVISSILFLHLHLHPSHHPHVQYIPSTTLSWTPPTTIIYSISLPPPSLSEYLPPSSSFGFLLHHLFEYSLPHFLSPSFTSYHLNSSQHPFHLTPFHHLFQLSHQFQPLNLFLLFPLSPSVLIFPTLLTLNPPNIMCVFLTPPPTSSPSPHPSSKSHSPSQLSEPVPTHSWFF